MPKSLPYIAKVSRPAIAETYPRKRLFNILDLCCKHPVVWIAGPAGSGKTTLVSSYIDAKKLPSLWYRLDERDGDLATFFYYMGIAGKKAAPRKRKPLPLLTPEYMMGIPAFTKRYFEDLFSRLKPKSVVVIDNYQDIQGDSDFHGMIYNGLLVIPQGVTVVIMSRKSVPQELARLCADGAIYTLEWEEIRFSPEETKGLVRLSSRKNSSEETVQWIHERARGWAAGIILLSRWADKKNFQTLLPHADTPKEIFNYFAGEIFERTNGETREFLLKTALLPDIYEEMTEKLTGSKRAGEILSGLYNSHFFIERSNLSSGEVYRYHPLFKAYLSEEALKRLGENVCRDVQRQAAYLLEEAGRLEDAADMLMNIGEWHKLILLILNQAPSLAAQGRCGVMEKWLSSLPKEELDANPWLLYWLAACRMPFDPINAQDLYGRAYQAFQGGQDTMGMCMAWIGAIDSGIFGWQFKTLKPWIRRMEELIETGLSFPSPESEVRVSFSIFGALGWTEPWHAKMSFWANQLNAIALTTQDNDFKLILRCHLFLYYSWLGDLSELAVLHHGLELDKRSLETNSPHVRIFKLICDAIYWWHVNETGQCLRAVKEAEEIGDFTGVRVFNIQAVGQAVYGSLSAGDLATAHEYLQKMHSAISGQPLLISVLYHHLMGWLSCLSGDIDSAFGHVQYAVDIAVKEDAPFILASNQIALALLCVERNDFERIVPLLNDVLRTGVKMKSAYLEYNCLLIQALAAFKQGKEIAGLESLRRAFLLMRQTKRVTHPWWIPSLMSELCVKALEANIEVEYVKDLVKKRGLVPESPPLHIEIWPWPLQIYTLGRLSILQNGSHIPFSGRAHWKSTKMLKVIIALGGRGIREQRITDILWPESEGDVAHSAFSTTLSRLRKLLGSDEAVELKDGQVSLDARRCWVDAWAFERMIAAAPEKGTDLTEESARAVEKAMKLYHSEFLAGDDEDWVMSLREKLRRKFLRGVIRLGLYREQKGSFIKAIECYEKGLAVDDLAEELYQHLMRCYHGHGRNAEALQTYERCRCVLGRTFGMEPSHETSAIYRKIGHGSHASSPQQ